jgi:hypothetical protein
MRESAVRLPKSAPAFGRTIFGGVPMFSKYPALALAACGACLPLSGCAGAGSAGTPTGTADVPMSPSAQLRSAARLTTFYPAALAPFAVPAPRYRGPGWISAAARAATTTTLFVSNAYTDDVTLYDVTSRNGPPIGTITTGISGPAGLAVDKPGNLYVSNTANGTVTMYAPGQKTPAVTYSKELTFPGSVAVGVDGTVYVGNIVDGSFSPGSVVEYPKGSTTPSLTIKDSNFLGVAALALDAKNNLYVTYNDPSGFGQINEYAPGRSKGKNLGITTGFAGGIAFDGSGDLVTADQTLPGIEVFPPGQTKPSRMFGTAGAPDPIAFSSGHFGLFVGDGQQNEVLVYDYQRGLQKNHFSKSVEVPAGVAISPAAL